jgi:hypothetical protein
VTRKCEEHTDRGKVLLHRGRRSRMVLDVGGDDDRGDLGERSHAMRFAPCEELANGFGVT